MLAPCTMVITVMRVATPIVRPSIVKEARSLCARRALKHSARLSRMASIGEEEHSLIARIYPSSVLDGKSGAGIVAVAKKGLGTTLKSEFGLLVQHAGGAVLCRSGPLGAARGATYLSYSLFQPAAMIFFEGNELLVELAEFFILRGFCQPTVKTNGTLFRSQRNLEGPLAWRAAYLELGDGEDLSIFQAGHFD